MEMVVERRGWAGNMEFQSGSAHCHQRPDIATVPIARSYLSGKGILGISKLVLVLGVMFDRSANQPEGAGLALDQQPAASVDRDLCQRRVFNIMIRNPQPVILQVQPR